MDQQQVGDASLHLWPEELPGESDLEYLDRVLKPGDLKAGQRILVWADWEPEQPEPPVEYPPEEQVGDNVSGRFGPEVEPLPAHLTEYQNTHPGMLKTFARLGKISIEDLDTILSWKETQ